MDNLINKVETTNPTTPISNIVSNNTSSSSINISGIPKKEENNIPITTPTNLTNTIPKREEINVPITTTKILATSIQPTNLTEIAPTKDIELLEPSAYNYKVPKNEIKTREINGVIIDEHAYHDLSQMPVDPKYESSPFDYGYSFLPPEKWYPIPPYPPVCVTDKQCPVCPMNTSGSPINLMEWHESRRITPPDNINVKFVEEKLNAGR
jgi:hypothetical protein